MLGKKGFTLIELLVVIAIIAILAVLIILALNTARIRARDSRRRSDLRSTQTSLELYNDSNGKYPTSAGYSALNTELLTGSYGVDTQLPADPQCDNTLGSCAANTNYGYAATASTGVDYALGTLLEGQAGNNDDACGATNSYTHCVGTNIGLDPLE